MLNVLKSTLKMLLLSCLFLVAGCSQKTKLEAGIESANKQCPISLGAAGEVTGIRFDGTDVVYELSVDDAFLNLEALSKSPESMKAGIGAMLSNPKGDVKKTLELVIEAGSGIKYIYKGKTSGQEASCYLNTDELKAILDENLSQADIDRKQLEEIVNLTNVSLPITVDEATTLVRLGMEGEQVVYDYTIDEDAVKMSVLKENERQLRQQIKSSWSVDDASMKMFLESCSKCGKGIGYRYTGNTSGEVLYILFDNSEVKSLFLK